MPQEHTMLYGRMPRVTKRNLNHKQLKLNKVGRLEIYC